MFVDSFAERRVCNFDNNALYSWCDWMVVECVNRSMPEFSKDLIDLFPWLWRAPPRFYHFLDPPKTKNVNGTPNNWGACIYDRQARSEPAHGLRYMTLNSLLRTSYLTYLLLQLLEIFVDTFLDLLGTLLELTCLISAIIR